MPTTPTPPALARQPLSWVVRVLVGWIGLALLLSAVSHFAVRPKAEGALSIRPLTPPAGPTPRECVLPDDARTEVTPLGVPLACGTGAR